MSGHVDEVVYFSKGKPSGRKQDKEMRGKKKRGEKIVIEGRK